MSNLLGPVGERLREERLRMDLKQEALAEKAGTSKNSLAAYELGRTPINAMLLLILQDIGVDIAYVMTGRRTSGGLNPADAQLLNMLGKLSVRERAGVFNLVSTLAGEAIGMDELQTLSELRATLHSPTRDFKGPQ